MLVSCTDLWIGVIFFHVGPSRLWIVVSIMFYQMYIMYPHQIWYSTQLTKLGTSFGSAGPNDAFCFPNHIFLLKFPPSQRTVVTRVCVFGEAPRLHTTSSPHPKISCSTSLNEYAIYFEFPRMVNDKIILCFNHVFCFFCCQPN